ncbi:MAG TPA: MerR family transcriptional regulator [Actinomycetota bacterium]|nr:MerR family transcriptional regulator [Actinomycetota bacterium]
MKAERSYRNYMTIGDVIKTLSEEFPDVTLSKVRFLEAEGLIEPERTPSGYRRFYQEDLDKLRYILRLQRDHFVPLKVIRKRLEHFDPSETPDNEAPEAPAPPPILATKDDNELETLEGGLSLSFNDFVNATGMTEEEVKELEDYGLVHSHPLPTGGSYFDEDDLLVAKIAKDFAKFGIHARHLRMYKNFAEKEAGLFEQVVIPLSRGGGESRKGVSQSLNDLAKLSRRLKQVMLKSRLKEYLSN